MLGKERDKLRERKKRGNRKYGQARFKHAKKGIQSCIVAAAIAVILLLSLTVSYVAHGNVGIFFGLLGLISFGLACVGVVLAIRGFREREKNYLTCKLGIGFNGAFILSLIVLFVGGF